jgi:integrase
MAKRREWGSGSVYQDKTGQWWARVSIGPGRYRRARVASEQEGRRQVKAWIEELEAGTDLRTSRLTLRRWIERWLTDLTEAQRVKPRTLEFYQRHAEYAVNYIGHIALEALEPGHWRDCQRRLLADGLSKRSVNHVHTVVGTALEVAKTDRAISVNPLRLVDKLPLGDDAFEARALSDAEMAALDAACQGERLGILYRFILSYGLRHGEARALRWPDVALDSSDPGFNVRDSKSKAGRRFLPLTDAWVAELRAHWKEQAEERLIAGERWKEHGYVFPSDVGTLLTESNSTRTFKRLLRKAQLDTDIRIHDLRHTAITDWVSSGGPKEAQGLAGHSNSAVTMDIYAKSRRDRQRETIERVEARRRKEQA